jgi:LmbE family N-acetylglucosaminyl deacetylase
MLTEFVSVVPDEVFERLIVVSPHFDDAVLGAGQLLAKHSGATVVTVMGGDPRPGAYDKVSDWDAYGGFAPGDDVVAARQKEDAEALAVLGAHHVWLDFADHQYDADGPARNRPSAVAVGDALGAAIDERAPTAVVVPMGLANPDHELTHDACRLVIAQRLESCAWFAYAEAGYLHIPGILAWRLGQLFRAGLWPTPAPVVADDGLVKKQQALRCYRTQLPALDDDWGYDVDSNARIAESYWRLAPPPHGWDGLVNRV